MHRAVRNLSRRTPDEKRDFFPAHFSFDQATVCMTHPLPPLNPLRAFEALARLGSLAAAATELHVTSGAISHQVKALESSLGVSLFHREGRHLRLTASGGAYAREVRQGLRLIAESTLKLGMPAQEGRLRVYCPPTLAACWLARELGDFRRSFPEVQLDICAQNLDAAGVAHAHYDLAIVYGAGEWADRQVRLLTQIQIYPVCHPRFFPAANSPRRPDELQGRWLLHEDGGGNWKRWLAAVDAGIADAERGTYLGNAHLAIEAACAGGGVAIGDDVVCANYYRQGRLVRLFSTTVPAPGAYYLVCDHQRATQPRVMAFSNWLLERMRHAWQTQAS